MLFWKFDASKGQLPHLNLHFLLCLLIYTRFDIFIQAWLHEKLRLLEPPQSIAQYRAKHYRTRRLYPIPEDIQSWLSTFSDTMIQWMFLWWRLQHVMLHSYTYCIPVANLHLPLSITQAGSAGSLDKSN